MGGTAAVSETVAGPCLSLWYPPGAWPELGAVGFTTLLPWHSLCCPGSLMMAGTRICNHPLFLWSMCETLHCPVQAQADASAAPEAELSRQAAAAEAALQEAAAQAVEQQQQEAIPEAQGLFSEADQAAGDDPVHPANEGPNADDAVAEVSQTHHIGSAYTSRDQQHDNVLGVAALNPVLSARIGRSLGTLLRISGHSVPFAAPELLPCSQRALCICRL